MQIDLLRKKENNLSTKVATKDGRQETHDTVSASDGRSFAHLSVGYTRSHTEKMITNDNTQGTCTTQATAKPIMLQHVQKHKKLMKAIVHVTRSLQDFVDATPNEELDSSDALVKVASNFQETKKKKKDASGDLEACKVRVRADLMKNVHCVTSFLFIAISALMENHSCHKRSAQYRTCVSVSVCLYSSDRLSF